jgi:hypothetical protein
VPTTKVVASGAVAEQARFNSPLPMATKSGVLTNTPPPKRKRMPRRGIQKGSPRPRDPLLPASIVGNVLEYALRDALQDQTDLHESVKASFNRLVTPWVGETAVATTSKTRGASRVCQSWGWDWRPANPVLCRPVVVALQAALRENAADVVVDAGAGRKKLVLKRVMATITDSLEDSAQAGRELLQWLAPWACLIGLACHTIVYVEATSATHCVGGVDTRGPGVLFDAKSHEYVLAALKDALERCNELQPPLVL